MPQTLRFVMGVLDRASPALKESKDEL